MKNTYKKFPLPTGKEWYRLPERVKKLEDYSDNVTSEKYKVYTAIITQISNNNPEITVLNNTTGDEIVWTRRSIGIYRGTFQNSTPDGSKTVIFLDQNKTNLANPVTSLYEGDGIIKLFSTQFVVNFEQQETDYVYVDMNSAAGVAIEIRIYN